MPPVSEGSGEGVGARLKRLRLQKGFSQRDLSSPGVSYAYISRIEAGARTPSVKALRKLAQKLGISVEYLETGRDIRDVDDRELRLADAELELRLADDVRPTEKKLDEAPRGGERRRRHDVRGPCADAIGLAAAQRGGHSRRQRLEAAVEEDSAPPPHLRPDLYATLGQSYAALGAPDRAVRIFEECLAQVSVDVPEDGAIHIRYATFLSYALTDTDEIGAPGDRPRCAVPIRRTRGSVHARPSLLVDGAPRTS